MSEPKEPLVPLMTRLPKDLHAAVKKFSIGNGKRPKASLNDTVIFLLTRGLQAEGAKVETEPGQTSEVLLAA